MRGAVVMGACCDFRPVHHQLATAHVPRVGPGLSGVPGPADDRTPPGIVSSVGRTSANVPSYWPRGRPLRPHAGTRSVHSARGSGAVHRSFDLRSSTIGAMSLCLKISNSIRKFCVSRHMAAAYSRCSRNLLCKGGKTLGVVQRFEVRTLRRVAVSGPLGRPVQSTTTGRFLMRARYVL